MTWHNNRWYITTQTTKQQTQKQRQTQEQEQEWNVWTFQYFDFRLRDWVDEWRNHSPESIKNPRRPSVTYSEYSKYGKYSVNVRVCVCMSEW